MQNHQPYGPQYPDNEIEVVRDDMDAEKKQEMETYLQGLRYSDGAMKELIEKLDSLDKKVMVVFWGDHYPGSGIYTDMYKGNEVELHKTPLLMYNNFGLEREELGTKSLNFVQTDVLNSIGEKISPFQKLLTQVNGKLSTLSKIELFDNNQNKQTKKEIATIEELKDYRMIEYDVNAGKRYSLKTDFYK